MLIHSAFFFFCATFTVRGLYEDQIGVFDWNHKFVGEINFVELGRSIYVGSARNVIASLSADEGVINWRHVLEEDGKLTNFHLCDDYILAVSVRNTVVVRSWDSKSSSILWEKLIESPTSSTGLICDPTSNTVLIATDSGFFAFNLRNGKIIWSSEQPSSSGLHRIQLISFSSKSNGTFKTVVALGSREVSSESTDLAVTVLQMSLDAPQNVTVIDRKGFSLDPNHSCILVSAPARNSDTQLREPFLVCVTFNPSGPGGILKSVSLSTGAHTEWKTIHTSPSPSSTIKRLTDSQFLVTSVSGHGAVFELSHSGVAELKYSEDHAMLTSFVSFGDQMYLFAASHDSNQPFKNFLLHVYDAITGKPIPEWTTLRWTIAKHHGASVGIVASVFKDLSGSLGFRLLIQTEDRAIQMFREDGQPRWVRDEALADIVAVEIVDLPVSESQARMEEEFGHTQYNILEMFIRRFRTQAFQLLAFFKDWITGFPLLVSKLQRSLSTILPGQMSISSQTTSTTGDQKSQTVVTVPPRLKFVFSRESAEMEEDPMELGRQRTRPMTNLNELLTRDTFNLHKMIVVATAVGKVFGLESGRGRVVWEHLVPAASVLANGKMSLFQQRNTAHFPLPPISTLLLRSKHTNLPMLFSFNPITGVPIEEVFRVPFDVIQTVLSPIPVKEDTDYIRPLLILDTTSQVHVYPSQYSSSLGPDCWPVYVFTVDQRSAHITGYSLLGPSPDPTTSSTYKAAMVWRMTLRSSESTNGTGESHKIVAAASRSSTEHIYSVGRILGDRSVMYKYLNPNLIAVLTSGGDVVTQSNTVVLYLIDVVSGRVVHSATHRRCGEPINLVHSENWIVYSYYNHKSLRHEVTVLELFELAANGEPCAAYSVPGPAQLFLQNILPTSWISNLFSSPPATDSISRSHIHQHLGYKSLSTLGSRSIFSSLFRTTDFDGTCIASGTSSLIPQILQQSYIFSSPPLSGVASATLTERGITSKSIIFGLQKGSLIELPKSFFDPRRSIDLTPDLVEEGVLPYTPVLLMPDQAVISYNQSIMGMRAVRIAMTGLESTSLVLAYGLDMFFTRVAPSMTYDLLKEDFDYTAIATVTLGMIVASIVTQRLAARRSMFRAWA